jgi:hypothetical protein
MLRASARIVPPDSLLKFGYSPNGGIEFDSASALLSFTYGGSAKAAIGSFGLSVSDGEGLIVGSATQVTAAGVTSEFQMLGTGSADSRAMIGRFDNSNGHAGLVGLKSRAGIGGNTIVQDGDGVFMIQAAVDDGTDYASRVGRIAFEVDGAPGVNDTPGRIAFSTTGDGASSESERMRIDSSGGVFIGDSANTNMSVGLTINQGAIDDEILAFKSSDVAHGVTGITETDTYGFLKKSSTSDGGLEIQGIAETTGAGLELNGVHATGDTNKDGAGWAPVVVQASVKSGTTAVGFSSNENLFVIRTGGSTKFIVDEDGELFADGGTSTTNMVTLYDGEDDIALSRTLYHALSDNGAPGLVRDRRDDWVQTREQDLVDIGVLGAPLSEGGLINYTGLARLNTGAIWQLHTKHLNLVESVDSLTAELKSANQKLAALTAQTDQ